MVDAYQEADRDDVWFCSECGAEYDTQQEAEECCANIAEQDEEE